jgi:hypothetical protein
MKRINEVELASKLAKESTRDELVINGGWSEEDLFLLEENGDIHYVEEAQGAYDSWYNYYSEMIDMCKEPEV